MTSDIGILRQLAQFADPDLSSGLARGANRVFDVLARGGESLGALSQRLGPIAARIEGPEAEQAFFARQQQEELLRQQQAAPLLRQQRAEALERAIGRPAQQLPVGVEGPPAPGRAPDLGALARLAGLEVPGAQQFAQQAFKAQLGGGVSPTTLQRNLAAAGLRPGTPEFQQAVLSATTKPQVAITGERPTTTQTALAKADISSFVEVVDKAREIPEQRFNLEQSKALIKTTGTGAFDSAKILLNQLGLKVPAGASLEVVRSLSNRTVLPLIKALGTKPTDLDLRTIQQIVQGVGKSTEGNLAMISIQEQILDRSESHAKIIRSLSEQGLSTRNIIKALKDFDKQKPFQIISVGDIPAEQQQTTPSGISFRFIQ